MKKYYVYILKCSDDSYYTGVTNNLERRLKEHNSGSDEYSYTNSRKPLELVFEQAHYSPLVAIAWEKKIKKWSRSKKEALISGRFDLLPELSKKVFVKKKR